MELCKHVRMIQGLAPLTTSASATRTGAGVDMANYDGVLAILSIGAMATGAVNVLKWQQASQANFSDAEDLRGTGITLTTAAANTAVYSELILPRKRYVRAVVVKDGSNATNEALVYVVHSHKGKLPFAGISGSSFVSPEAGTP